jgi:hypothetical protein
MHAVARDFDRAFPGQPTAFEGFVSGLVRAAARACGMSPGCVSWDPRTNVADGGQDIVVSEGNPRGPGRFIPDRPSVWSVKSGADGVDPRTLREEVLPPTGRGRADHPKIREALARGWAFVWCAAHPVSPDRRDDMVEAAAEVASALGVGRNQFRFWWPDQLLAEANRFPNLIPVHLPDAAGRWSGVLTLEEWRREPGLSTPWAGFGERPALVERVAGHLLGRGTPNVLHLAGLSGVGKTRTVLEACLRREELHGVFYLTRFADLTPETRRALRDTEAAYLVVDETPPDEAEAVRAWFADCADRVRVVTIGPAARHRAVLRPDVLVVPEPRAEDEVLAVIRATGGGLPEAILRSIAALSAQDLRLALLLVRATLARPDLAGVPVVDLDGVWDRLTGLFRHEIRDPAAFRRVYAALSVAVDVGFDGEHRQELQALGAYFRLPEGELLACLNVAPDCGLGRKAGRFFEATPHALAVGLFRTVFREQLRDRMPEFLPSLPPRLVRRFLERCQECPDDIRDEVAAAVGRVVLGWLGEADVTALAGREASRLFRAWAEFDPSRGLAWLRRTVEAATSDELLVLDGEADGSGGWRGRRHLVWTCEHLAGFAEHFAACEAVLHRLARYETEPEIGNNGTAVWRSLFWPALTPTEVPFGERFAVLLGRLRAATADDLPLVLGAAFAAVESRRVGLGLPPPVVGGRVTPGPWMPATREQLLADRRGAAVQVLAAVACLPQPVRGPARRLVVRHLQGLAYLDLVDETRPLFPAADLPADLRRDLLVELDRQIGFERRVREARGEPVPPHVAQLEGWRAELAAGDLATRVQDLTARDYHDAWTEGGTDAPYAALAQELIDAPGVFCGLGDWFGADAARGARPLGFCLGRADAGGRLADTVREWLLADRCRLLAVGYLNGAARRGQDVDLPVCWAAALDRLAEVSPELAALATATADVGGRGLDRLLGLVDRLPAPASRFLRRLAYDGWGDRLTAGDQLRVLDTLLRLAGAGDPQAAGAGIELLRFWWHDRSPLDPGLVPAAFRLAAMAPAAASADNGHNWREVLRELCPHDPVRVAGVVLGVMTGPSCPWRLDDGNTEVLAEAARRDPDGVMEEIGRAVLDPYRRGIFEVDVFDGLFEAVGVDAVRRWVDEHGRETLPWVARHLASPSVGPGGEVVVPPLTAWLFTAHEDDREAFDWFLMGRHGGASKWSGDRVADRAAEMAPFRAHPLRRVRDWAAYEVRWAEREAAWFRRHDEEDGRL